MSKIAILDSTIVLIITIAILLLINSLNIAQNYKTLLYPFPLIFIVLWLAYAIWPRD